MASNRAIGLNNKMPWHLSADLKRFKSLTWGSPILMGRKTFESIGKPLPGRTNLIVSRNLRYQQPGCIVMHDVDSALAEGCQHADTVFVIGGSDLYETLLPKATTLHLTQIHQAFDGDAFFPLIDAADWHEVGREDIDDDPSVSFSYSFLQLNRRSASESHKNCQKPRENS